MKKLTLLFGLAVLPFLGMSQDMPRHKTPKPTKDSNVLDVTKNRGTLLSYETPSEVKVKFEKEAELNMWTPERKQEEWARYPKGGWLKINIGRLTIGEADTKYFTIIATDQTGTEIFRKELEGSVASPTTISSSITVWNNIGMVGLPDTLPTGSKVFVIDRLSKNRHEYLIQN